MKSKPVRRSSRNPSDDTSAPANTAAAGAEAAGLFHGRGVVVTGGATGIGRAIAAAFASAGARVTILDRDRKEGNRTVRDLRRINPSVALRVMDLADATAVRAAASLFRGPQGADILVNNAATVGRTARLVDLRRADWETVIRTNLLGHFLLSQIAAQQLVARHAGGSIVNLLTIQTVMPVPGFSAYVTSKGGLEAMTLAMAVDLAEHGIRVNGIRVGAVLTEAFRRGVPARLKREAKQAKLDLATLMDQRTATLLGRMGRPEEIAKVALFLASEDASYLTGSIVRADGGRLLSRKVEQLV